MTPGDGVLGQRDGDRAAIGHGITAVDGQIEKRGFQLIGVGAHAHDLEWKTGFNIDCGPERTLQ